MKKIFSGIILVSFLSMFTGCYKTGEIIYQTTCKPISIYLPTRLLGIIRGTEFSADIQYGFPNKRPVTIQRKDAFDKPIEKFTLEYDQSNNLVRENIYSSASSTIVSAYTEFSYPQGTTSSIADDIGKKYYILNNDGITYRLAWDRHYYFNTEFQLVKVTSNGKPMADFVYDFGGNLLKETMYTTYYDNNAAAGVLYFEYEFSNYDNKLNIFRSDRYLQLFFDVYSKNNPLNSSQRFTDFPDGSPNYQYYSGVFTYNSQGYWITCNPSGYYAVYDCSQ